MALSRDARERHNATWSPLLGLPRELFERVVEECEPSAVISLGATCREARRRLNSAVLCMRLWDRWTGALGVADIVDRCEDNEDPTAYADTIPDMPRMLPARCLAVMGPDAQIGDAAVMQQFSPYDLLRMHVVALDWLCVSITRVLRPATTIYEDGYVEQHHNTYWCVDLSWTAERPWTAERVLDDVQRSLPMRRMMRDYETWCLRRGAVEAFFRAARPVLRQPRQVRFGRSIAHLERLFTRIFVENRFQ